MTKLEKVVRLEQSKAYTHCKQIKPLSDYGKNSSMPTGLHYYCRTCVGVITKKWRTNNVDKFRASSFTTRKKRSEQVKEYNKNWNANNKERKSASAKKYNEINRVKNLERERRYLANNREKVYSKNNARRARLRNAKHFVISEKEIRRLYSSPCFYCGFRGKIHLDHIVPIAKGGNHSIGNLVASCQKCNSSKTDKFLIEWRIWLQNVVDTD